MIDKPDSGTSNPLSETPQSSDEISDIGEYRLAEVVRGRMFCLAHGRECYRRSAIISESEWVCPDERHRKPIRSS